MSEDSETAEQGGTCPGLPSRILRVDAACELFEAGWRGGHRPRVEQFLGEVPDAERPALLRELLVLEVELRQGFGERLSPAEYRDRFPEHAALVDRAFEEAATSVPVAADRARADEFGTTRSRRSWHRRSVAACEGYARAQGKRPIEAFLAERVERDRPALLRELLRVDLELRRAGGESPVPEDYVGRFPGQDGVIASAFEESTWSRQGGTPLPAAAARGPSSASRPRFRALRLHAKGGLGEVHVAWDEQLQREVALKRIKGRHAFDLSSQVRFEFEAKVTGRLEHPGVVPVHALGKGGDGRPYYIMRFIRGESLRAAIATLHGRERGGDLPRLALRQLLARFVAVCHTVAFAHNEGILHRDLKPDNVMLGPFGETLVVDWGLAKLSGAAESTQGNGPHDRPTWFVSGETGATQPGSVVGTPAYMSPEQAAGQHDRQGPRSDVYSLGAILYCLLTGRSAIQGVDCDEVFARVLAADFPPPRALRASIPRALEAVCLKAMAYDPGGRYPSAKVLAEDVERWLADEPVLARREPLLEQLLRWGRRHRPWVVSVTAAVLVAGGLWVAKRQQDERREREAAARTREAEQSSKFQAYHALLGKAQVSRSDPKPGATWSGLRDIAAAAAIDTPARDPVALRSEAAHSLLAFDARPVAAIEHGLNTGRIVFSPDGRLLAAAEFKAQLYLRGRVVLIDVAARSVRHTWTYDGANPLARFFKERSQEGTCDLAFSPDGRWLALGLRSGRVFVWETSRPETPALVWSAHATGLSRLVFGPGSRALWTASGGDKSVKRWRLEGERWATPPPVAVLPIACEVCDLAVGPGVLWVADRATRRAAAFDLETLAPRGEIAGLGTRIALDPGGRTIAGASGPEVRLADVGRHAIYQRLANPNLFLEDDPGYTTLEFSPDGAWLASCVEYDTPHVGIWEVASGRLVRTVPWLSKGRGSCAFSPDGRLLAVTGDRKSLLYELRTAGESRALAHVAGRILDFDWVTGRTLACVSERGGRFEISRWNTATGRRIEAVDVLPGRRELRRTRLAAHPGGSLALQLAGVTYVWERRLSEASAPLAADFEGEIGFTPDGGRLWGAARDEWVESWSLVDRKRTRYWKDEANAISGTPGVNGLAVGGRWVVEAVADGFTKVVDTSHGTRRPVALWTLSSTWNQSSDPPVGVALDAAETLVASGTRGGRIRIQTLPDGAEVARFDAAHRGAVETLSFSPGGRVLASGAVDGTVRLWSRSRDGRWVEAMALASALGPVRRLRFSPDGTRLAVLVRNEASVRLWDLRLLHDGLATLGLNAPRSDDLEEQP